MARLLIQSKISGRFLCPSSSGEPEWVVDLREAGGGVFTDMDQAAQLIDDNCDFFDDLPIVVDLDRLGTVNDYPLPIGSGVRGVVAALEGLE